MGESLSVDVVIVLNQCHSAPLY